MGSIFPLGNKFDQMTSYVNQIKYTNKTRYTTLLRTIYINKTRYVNKTRLIHRYVTKPSSKTVEGRSSEYIDINKRYKNNSTYIFERYGINVSNMKLCEFLVFDKNGEIQYPRGKQRGASSSYVRETYNTYLAGLRASANDKVKVLWGGTALHAVVGGDWSHDNDVELNDYQLKKYSCVCFYGNKPALCGNKKGAKRVNGYYPGNQQPEVLEHSIFQFGSTFWMELKTTKGVGSSFEFPMPEYPIFASIHGMAFDTINIYHKGMPSRFNNNWHNIEYC